MYPSISCIIPVFNGAEYLAEAIESILSQTLPPSEIIIVDDGSTDGTPDVAARYVDRALYVRQPNKGPAGARNRGLRLAGSDYLSFLDADNVWHPQMLERQYDALQADPQAGLSLAHIQNFWIPELAHERELLKNHPSSRPTIGYVCQAMLARKSVFDTVGKFDEKLRAGADTDWFARLAGAGIRKAVVEQTLVYRRIYGSKLSNEISQSPGALAAILSGSRIVSLPKMSMTFTRTR